MGKTKRTWVPNFSRSERVGFRVLAVLIFTVQVFFQWGPDVFPSLNSPSYSENQREVWVHRLSDTAVLLQAPRGQFANRRSSTRYVPTSPSARPNQPQSSQQKSDLTTKWNTRMIGCRTSDITIPATVYLTGFTGILDNQIIGFLLMPLEGFFGSIDTDV